MKISCSQCGADVPEGAVECPKCKASINTAVFGKKKSLTRTLISKAAELRDDIPWATTSMFALVDDGAGKKKRKLRGWVFAAAAVLVLAVAAAVAWYLRAGPEAPPAIAAAAPDVPAKAAPAKPAKPPPAKPAPKASKPPAAAKRGTLSIDALHRGQSVRAKVEVNGDDQGTTPVSIPLAPGKYTVKIEKAGFIAAKLVDVAVDSGKNTELKIDLRK